MALMQSIKIKWPPRLIWRKTEGSRNSVGTQLFFLGCNQDSNPGSNFITKKKICFVPPEKEISSHINY